MLYCKNNFEFRLILIEIYQVEIRVNFGYFSTRPKQWAVPEKSG